MASISRKDFFKKIGLGIGVVVSTPVSAMFSEHLDDDNLSVEKKQFLTEYELWLHDFHNFVEKRNKNILDEANNKRLMELSDEAAKRKPLLEQHMKDSRFAGYFNTITASITRNIQS
ncbi:MAG: hypothetical protein CVU09_16440 [Bacteroidetes bacterium HGW-Bacteroidetes-4]|jgi:hypothetical protein|nr:MAG: hypothetical protein CVU09_16440 [Bacteroidetes bacterium HGW-Bacteroidetes-4]